jgi:phosphoribosylglycinamide formyltransferase 1
MLNFASFFSGGASTMERLVIEAQEGSLVTIAKPTLVVASSPKAGGIEKARRLGLGEKEILILSRENFVSAHRFCDKVLTKCRENSVEAIFLNGWLKLIPEEFIEEFRDKIGDEIINQHPTYLVFGGRYIYGLATHMATLKFRDRIKPERELTHTTPIVHRVTKEFDMGSVVGSTKVKIFNEDTPQTLQDAVIPHEHQLLVNTVKKVARSQLFGIETEQVVFSEDEDMYFHIMKQAAEECHNIDVDNPREIWRRPLQNELSRHKKIRN